ncbi:MAG: bis(5'-nucleosyl)-tetraphosphatase (symmetrical) YqeK [Candidatus Gastranaerophilales bacterium]|nr:bis(5'-nucleosyl)-tetraphosphatase (symmetrical) YqeK [Candidatus Gastranaerophilales bacterium]
MNCTKTNEKAISWLQGNLDEERLLHSLGCAQCAAELAQRFGEDEKRAYIAGLLHDCAKCLDPEKMFDIAKELHLKEGELTNPKVIHAPVSAYIARTEFGIEDEEMLSAIRWHTLGKLDMTLFEKIIYLADKIEPNTRDLDFRDKILMFLDEENGLNKALLICYKESIKSLVIRGLKICQDTVDIYNSMI